MHDIFILNDNHQLYDALKLELPYYTGEVSSKTGLDRNTLKKIARASVTEYFFIITNSSIIFNDDFEFDYRPDEFSKDLMHVWGENNYVRLLRTSAVLTNVDAYTDESLYSGKVGLKKLPDSIYRHRPYDIIFLSYKENDIAEKWAKFKSKNPTAIHVSGIKGIMEAHRQAALISKTSMFYVVDADANVCPDFKFDYVPKPGQENFIHVWRSYNHSINIAYGYGGIKLFPTIMIREVKHWNLDFTTSVKTGFVAMADVSNETVINDTEYNAWKSAFRECVKLSSSMLPNDSKSMDRLKAWLNPNENAKYSEWVREGAVSGTTYGSTYVGSQSKLKLINDYEWLEKRFLSLTNPNIAYGNYFWDLKNYAEYS